MTQINDSVGQVDVECDSIKWEYLVTHYNIPESQHINIFTSTCYRHSREIELIKQQIHYFSGDLDK